MEESFLLWIHTHASPALDAVFSLSHHLGTKEFCAALVLVMAIVEVRAKRPRQAGLWAGLGASTYLIQLAMKVGFDRVRPALWVGPVERPDSAAFPSGHALAAATLFPLLGLAIAARWPERRRIALGFGVALAFFVGFGRLYLGVHWPTDVLGGWAIGAGQLLLAMRLVRGQPEGVPPLSS